MAIEPVAGDWDGIGAVGIGIGIGIGMSDDSTPTVYLRNATSAGGNDYTIS
ncbi:hypothetical protein [Streptomyces collinus]|uniref:hypothetical protein n=1 Tax=Streptomyces collinus TaxID=42684 RepID=UPI00332D408F